MSPHPYWTADRLATLCREIDEFEQLAFSAPFKMLADRKKAMSLAAHGCSDDNVKSMLARSIGYLSKHPDWVRRDIGLARSHVELLRGL